MACIAKSIVIFVKKAKMLCFRLSNNGPDVGKLMIAGNPFNEDSAELIDDYNYDYDIMAQSKKLRPPVVYDIGSGSVLNQAEWKKSIKASSI